MRGHPSRLAAGRVACWLAVALCAAGCGAPAGPDSPGEAAPATRAQRIEQAQAAAARFLLAQQAADGAWRSELKGPFKDGGSLTPLVVHALAQSGGDGRVRDACRRGADYLAAMARSDGSIDPGPFGLSYPVYTSALAVVVLSDPAHARHRAARDAWLAYLRARQLTEDLGWQPEDRQYGGWGFCSILPRKPPPGEFGPPLLESNLSATVFALEALRAAGCPEDDPAFRKALTFVRRCQNWADDTAAREPRFDDGGFFFIYDDPVRNKAGSAGKDGASRERFHSYGSTTADGLRALLLCGRPRDDERVRASRTWLERNFNAASHPGDYAASRQRDREAVYYYYVWSAAKALRATGMGAERLEQLADALLERQQPDGSWVNDYEQVREDDPLVATPLVLAALAECRAVLDK
jgi:squalene-hopene/tetraprenyl-beta-curcumene cyclase